jgi:hypothetical protein
VSRVELDQRSREASLRLEQIERLLKPPVRVRHSRFLRLVYLLSPGTCSATPQCSPCFFSASVCRSSSTERSEKGHGPALLRAEANDR